MCDFPSHWHICGASLGPGGVEFNKTEDEGVGNSFWILGIKTPGTNMGVLRCFKARYEDSLLNFKNTDKPRL